MSIQKTTTLCLRHPENARAQLEVVEHASLNIVRTPRQFFEASRETGVVLVHPRIGGFF